MLQPPKALFNMWQITPQKWPAARFAVPERRRSNTLAGHWECCAKRDQLWAITYHLYHAPKGWIHFLSVQRARERNLTWLFQCPEGLNSFSIPIIRYFGSSFAKFQCPEGLNSFSIHWRWFWVFYLRSSFNAPKGWIHFLSQGRRNCLWESFLSFNAPKGWIHFLSFLGNYSYRKEKVGFNAPKGWIHFLSGERGYDSLSADKVSMPRRAEFIFYLDRG